MICDKIAVWAAQKCGRKFRFENGFTIMVVGVVVVCGGGHGCGGDVGGGGGG